MFKKLIFLLFMLFSCTSQNDLLTYNLVVEPATIDPHQFTEMISVQLSDSIYEGLLSYENGKYIPALAKSYKETETSFEFELRDAYWSNGDKISAEDVVYGFRRALNPKTAARFAELLYPIKNAMKYNKGEASEQELGVYVTKNNTVKIELEKPSAYFKYILTLPISFPVKVGTDNDIVDYKTALYNGPYTIVSKNNEEIILKANEKYWDYKHIKYKNIRYLMIKDFSVVENLIKNEELDIARVEAYDLEGKRKTNQLLNYQNGRIWYLDFNLDNEILKDINARKAISQAIDREVYVRDIKQDGSVKAKSVISNILDNFREKYDDSNYFLDNQKSNYLKGKKLRLLASNTSVEIKEANFIQEELRKNLGLTVDVTIVSFKDRLALTRQGNYDIVLNTYSPKFNDPYSILDRWNRPKKGNYDVWRKQEYEDILKEVLHMPKSKKRDELLHKAEKILIDDVVIAPLYYSTENWFIRSKIKNVIVDNVSNTMKLHKLK